MKLVGIDGCKAGWIAVGQRDGELTVELWSDLKPLFSWDWDQAMIDIPIGFSSGSERRVCDVEARKLLGKKRSSIFFAPRRDFIRARDYEEVRVHGMSLQSFYLLPKIREVDELITPSHQTWLHESHPELSYSLRSSQELDKKKTARGREQRQDLLTHLGSPFLLADWTSKYRRKDVALDDFLDAAILLEVARDHSKSLGRKLGDETRDSRGLKMEICF